MTHLKKFWWVYLLIVAAVATIIWKWSWIAAKLGIGMPSTERSRYCATCCTTQNVSCPTCNCSHYRVAGSPVLDARGNIK